MHILGMKNKLKKNLNILCIIIYSKGILLQYVSSKYSLIQKVIKLLNLHACEKMECQKDAFPLDSTIILTTFTPRECLLL